MRSWSYCHVIVLRSSDTVLVEQFRTASWAFCTMTFCGCFVMEANDSEITATVNNCTHSVANFLQSLLRKQVSKSKWVMFMLDTESSSPSFRAWHRRGRCPPCRSVHAALPSPNQVAVGAGRFRYDCIRVLYCTPALTAGPSSPPSPVTRRAQDTSLGSYEFSNDLARSQHGCDDQKRKDDGYEWWRKRNGHKMQHANCKPWLNKLLIC